VGGRRDSDSSAPSLWDPTQTMRLPGGNLSREDMVRMSFPEFQRHCVWIQRRAMIRSGLVYLAFIAFLAFFYWSNP